jgi:hypothetical protein
MESDPARVLSTLRIGSSVDLKSQSAQRVVGRREVDHRTADRLHTEEGWEGA